MFRRILVAIDGSDAARSAFVFVTDWVRRFDGQVWFIELTDEPSRRPCKVVTDVGDRGRLLANSFMVSGATRGARNHRLVWAIAGAARAYRADLIVLGFDPRRTARRRFAKGVSELLTGATEVPVLVASPESVPTRVAARREAQPRPPSPIALGPVRKPAASGLALAGS